MVDYGYGSASFVMPNVLAKLRADVLAVNPYTSTAGGLAFDRVAATRRVAELVRASGAHLGAVFDQDGERLTVIDDEGDVLTDIAATLALVELVCDHLLGDRVALPVDVTAQADRVAERHGVNVQHTKISTPALMEAALRAGRRLRRRRSKAATSSPASFPPSTPPPRSSRCSTCWLATGGSSPRSVAACPAVHMAHETVVTPWEQKGPVMRSLMEGADGELVLVDGVKVRHGATDGPWTLALPDPEDAVTHLWAEGPTAAAARGAVQGLRPAHSAAVR